MRWARGFCYGGKFLVNWITQLSLNWLHFSVLTWAQSGRVEFIQVSSRWLTASNLKLFLFKFKTRETSICNLGRYTRQKEFRTKWVIQRHLLRTLWTTLKILDLVAHHHKANVLNVLSCYYVGVTWVYTGSVVDFIFLIFVFFFSEKIKWVTKATKWRTP